MCKYILIGLILALVVLMVVAAVVVQEYGWTGFLVLLGALVVVVYLARWLLPSLLRYLMVRPLRRMGAALQDARIILHAVTPCERPSPDEYFSGSDEDSGEDEMRDDEAIEDEDEFDDDEMDQPAPSLDWYAIDFTVVPRDAGSSEGRIVHRRAWTPGLIGAVGPRPDLRSANPFRGWPPPEQFDLTHVQNAPAELFDGENFGREREQVFGEARLQMRVGVARNISAVTITYAHFTNIGIVPIPRIDIRPESTT